MGGYELAAFTVASETRLSRSVSVVGDGVWQWNAGGDKPRPYGLAPQNRMLAAFTVASETRLSRPVSVVGDGVWQWNAGGDKPRPYGLAPC